MTLVLFFVNNYFSKEKKETQELLVKQNQEALETKVLVKEKELKERTISLKDLPLYPLYKENNEKDILSWAFLSGSDTFLTIAWEDEMPATLVTKDSQGAVKKLSRKTPSDEKGSLALYSAQEKFDFYAAFVPEFGIQDVQVLSLNDPLEVHLGEYEEGQIFFPSKAPKNPSIVLHKMDDTYLPLGIYDTNDFQFLPFSSLSDFQEITQYKTPSPSKQTLKEESFYVLENNSMQLVFSTIGGAIAEINLPFQSKTDGSSIVLPINFDKIINKDYPSNSQFPSQPYYISKNGSSQLEKPVAGGYYPLLRRGIKKTANYPSHNLEPRFYAFNTLSEDPDTANMPYKVVSFDKQSIRFEGRDKNRRIIKTYTLPNEDQDAPYCVFASVKVEGDSRGLWISSGVPEVELISGTSTPGLKYTTVQNQKSVVEKLSLPKTSTSLGSVQPNWVSNSNGYFTLILNPTSEIGLGFQVNYVPGNIDPSRISVIDSKNELYPTNKYPGYEVHMPLKKSSSPTDFRLYFGPMDQAIFKRIDNTFTNKVTGYNPQFIQAQSFQGWFSFISEPFAKFLFLIMNIFFSVTHSWGFSIILLTVVLRLMMYPLNAWSIKSTLKLQEVSPQLKKLQEKNKKDPKKAQMEMMQFYKQHKINPFGGCIPLVIQMPFLFGMFDLLKSTFPLRGSSFIPGWINNLTSPDVLFSWSHPIPFIGTEFHLLPILLGVVMFFQQKLTTSQNMKTGTLTEQQKQQQKMGSIMTFVFTFMFYKFPSGLNIYWLSSMTLQIVQQLYMSSRKKKVPQNLKEVVIEKSSQKPK